MSIQLSKFKFLLPTVSGFIQPIRVLLYSIKYYKPIYVSLFPIELIISFKY